MKTLIAVPCFDMVNEGFASSMLELIKPGETVYSSVKNTLIYQARNRIAANAVKEGFDRVMWFDSDITFPEDTMIQLMRDMEETGADIVSGLYFLRKPGTKPVVFDNLVWNLNRETHIVESGATYYEDYPKDALFECAGIGFGCVMTTVDVLNRVGEKYGTPFTPLVGLGEDLSFCWRAAQCGAKIMCDSRIKCGHIGQVEFNEEWFLNEREKGKEIVHCKDCIKEECCCIRRTDNPNWFCADGEQKSE